MKRKIIFISVLIMLQSCTSLFHTEDPYGRTKINRNNNEKITEIKTNKEKTKVEKPIEKKYTPKVNTKRKLSAEEQKLYDEIYNTKKEKKGLNLTPEEQKLYDEIYNQGSTKKANTTTGKFKKQKVTLSEDGKEVLRLMKKVYNLIESYDIMQKKTIEAVEKIREQKEPDEDPLVVIKEIHKILKETRTRSYTLAVARVMRNRGVK